MTYQSPTVAGTKFPASIGLTDDQAEKGVALADGNIILGHPKSFATLAELQACPKGWLRPGNLGYVHLDPVAENNGKYVLSPNLLTWAKELSGTGSGASDANLLKGGLQQYETIAARNAIPVSRRRRGMRVSVWEDATAVASDGKLLPREFILTGKVLPGTPATFTEQVLPSVNVLEISYTDEVYVGYEDYQPAYDFEEFVSPSYAFGGLKLPKPPAPAGVPGYVIADSYDGEYAYLYDALDGQYQAWENLAERALKGTPPGGGALETIGKRTYTNVSLGQKAVKYSYDQPAIPETLGLQGTGDQSDVWTEVLPGGGGPAEHGHDDRYYTEAEVNAMLAAKADLDGGKIRMSQLPGSIVGQLEYRGGYDAAGDAPVLPDPTTVLGHYYVVKVAGTRHGFELGVGDWLVSDGAIWDKVDNTSEVSSVFGRKGPIEAQAGDYDADQISETATRVFLTPQEREKINNPILADHNHPIDEVEGLQAALNKLSVNEASVGDLSASYAVQFDRKRILAANITAAMQFTADPAEFKKGMVGRLELTCTSGAVPSFSAEFRKVAGDFVTPGLNYVEYHTISPNRIEYEIYQ